MNSINQTDSVNKWAKDNRENSRFKDHIVEEEKVRLRKNTNSDSDNSRTRLHNSFISLKRNKVSANKNHDQSLSYFYSIIKSLKGNDPTSTITALGSLVQILKSGLNDIYVY